MMIATVLAVLAAAPEISLAGDRVCASGEVKLRVGPTITTIESPFANASMKIDPLATPEVSVGRAKPGVFLVAGLTDGGASAHLSILALPDGGDCLSLSVAKTQSTKIDEAQRPSWEKFLAGYRGMNAADREKVSVALSKSLGTTAASAGGAFVACTVALATGVLVWSCVASVVDLGASLFANYLNAVREVLLASGKLTPDDSKFLKGAIAAATTASSLVTAVTAGKLSGEAVTASLKSLSGGLTVVNGVVSGFSSSEATELSVTAGIDSAKKYLYVLQVLRKVP